MNKEVLYQMIKKGATPLCVALYAYIAAFGFATKSSLSAAFGISAPTVLRGLRRLEKQGFIVRIKGTRRVGQLDTFVLPNN